MDVKKLALLIGALVIAVITASWMFGVLVAVFLYFKYVRKDPLLADETLFRSIRRAIETHAEMTSYLTLLLATPTFLRGYLKRAAPEQLRSVKLTVTGAEKLHDELAHAFKARFGIDVMQGYGLTETSPVASFNLPNRAPESGQPTNRLGSAGKLVPGLAAQIRHPPGHVAGGGPHPVRYFAAVPL